MAKALCFGSLNIDYIYQVPHFVGAGRHSVLCPGSGWPEAKG